ncbi:MAG: hypothetical protein ABIF40_06045 [archaeon]
MDLSTLEEFIHFHNLKIYSGPVPDEDFSKINPYICVASIITNHEKRFNYRWGCVLGLERVDYKNYNILFLGRFNTLEDKPDFLEKEIERIPYNQIDQFHSSNFKLCNLT